MQINQESGLKTFKDFFNTKTYNTSLTHVASLISSNMAKQHVDSKVPTSANYVAKIDYHPHGTDPTKDTYRVRVSNNGQPVVDHHYSPNEFINRVVRAQGSEPKKYATIKHDNSSPDRFKIATWGDK